MVHNQSKVSLKDTLEQSHGKIIALLVQNHGYLVVHENGSVTKLCSTYMVNRPGTAEYWTKIYPWLKCQVDLFNRIIDENFFDYFNLDRIEHGFSVWRSELGDIEVYYPGIDLVEYNFEII